MIHETIQLKKHSSFTPELKTYLLENYSFNENKMHPFVLIIPGGGYDHYGPREQESVALKMNSLGFHAAVLHYTLKPMVFPEALLDLAEAVSYIRKNANQYNIDSNKIILCGFSAGGHLAASLGAYWNSPVISAYTELTPEEIKPDYLLLNYPVITADSRFCHKGSIDNLISNLNQQQKDKLLKLTGNTSIENVVSIEKNISKFFPPSFIWHTTQDEAVPAENTLLLANELKKQGIEFEYHLFQRGKHGLALSSEITANTDGSHQETECSIWPELFVNWIKGF